MTVMRVPPKLLAFLVVVDALQRGQPMYHAAGTTHVLSAAFGVVLLGLAALALIASTCGLMYWRFRRVGWL